MCAVIMLTLCNPMDCARLLKNSAVGCHVLLQGIFLTQGSNLCLWCLLQWQVNPLPRRRLGRQQFYGDVMLKISPYHIRQKAFPGGSGGKDSTCKVGDQGSIPGSGRSSGEGMATHSSIPALRTNMERGAWWAIVHGVTKRWTRPRD